jgi:hypothetical protein
MRQSCLRIRNLGRISANERVSVKFFSLEILSEEKNDYDVDEVEASGMCEVSHRHHISSMRKRPCRDGLLAQEVTFSMFYLFTSTTKNTAGFY